MWIKMKTLKKKKIENSVFSPLCKNALGPAADYRFYFLYAYTKKYYVRDPTVCVCSTSCRLFLGVVMATGASGQFFAVKKSLRW